MNFYFILGTCSLSLANILHIAAESLMCESRIPSFSTEFFSAIMYMIGEGACFLFSVLIYDNQISKNLIKIKWLNYILITRCTVESLNTILIIHRTYKEITFTFYTAAVSLKS